MSPEDTNQTRTDGGTDLVEYGIEEAPGIERSIPLGIQHLLAMFLSALASRSSWGPARSSSRR
jgi:hypothetical protein